MSPLDNKKADRKNTSLHIQFATKSSLEPEKTFPVATPVALDFSEVAKLNLSTQNKGCNGFFNAFKLEGSPWHFDMLSISFHSTQPLLLQFRSTPQRSGWILRRAGAPEAPETQDFNDFRNDGIEKQILLPFHGWPHLCTPSEKWWRKTEGRQTCQVKDMQLTTSTCRLEEAQWFFQSDYTLVSLPFHVLSKGNALILICHRIPEKLTCPMKRNNLKRELHLPTIIFRRICSFSAGYLMDPHQHDISNASILRSQFFMIWSAFRSWTTKLSSSILQINTFSVPNFLEGFSFAKSHVLNILNIFNKSSIYHHLLSIYHHCLYV